MKINTKKIIATALFGCIFSFTAFQTTVLAIEDEYDPFIPGGGGWSDSAAFTPNGSATVIDNALEQNGKEFYTITTEAGNVFYLIVDRMRDSNNVYFLNAVTEKDLIALAEKSGTQISGSTDYNADYSGGNDEQKPQSEKEMPPAQNQGLDSNMTTLIYVGIAVVIVGVIGFYVKIIRPKRNGRNDDEFNDEFEEDDNSFSSDTANNEHDNDSGFEDSDNSEDTASNFEL